ncbi:MAG: SDR family oxidoreductase, partial [Clostridia bacterium]|nr:SDR family oxidoreductase [Clostridia bacterium]
CDISSADDRLALREYVDKNFGRLDLLVNNAGVACAKRLDILETTEESFDRLIKINTKGTFFMCQTFANFMLSKIGKTHDYFPRIVNISSNSSYTSSVSRGEYCISKAGVSMITKLFADRLGGYGIPVLEVRPGIIKTPMTEVVAEKYDKLIFEEGITPFRRWGTPEDVAKCVCAVALGLLDFSTGTAINADGGFHIKRL